MNAQTQAVRSALCTGVKEGAVGVPEDHIPKLTSAVEDALMPMREFINDRYDAADDRLVAIGQVAASMLTSPLLKTGERRKPANQQMVREVAKHALDEDNRLEVALALGGSEDPPSLRLMSYVGALLDVGDQFVNAGLRSPRLRIVAAHAISSSLNGLDATVAEHRAGQAEHFVDGLVSNFFPGLRGDLSFEHMGMPELIAKGHHEDSAHLLEALQGSVDEDNASSTALRKLLARATAKHAASREALEHEAIVAGYSAAHGLTFHNYRFPETTGVIKLGGNGEAPFDVIQQAMTERSAKRGDHVVNLLNGTPMLVNLRTHAGTLPPYYLEGPGELTVESAPRDLPRSVDDMVRHYQANNLRSGEDFTHLPLRLQSHFGEVMEAFAE